MKRDANVNAQDVSAGPRASDAPPACAQRVPLPPRPSQIMGRTPLMLASENGHHKVCEVLIDSSADVNSHLRGRTVLMMACQYGYANCTEHLLAAKADIEAKDRVSMPHHV